MKLEADFDRLNSGEVNSKALSVDVESELRDKQVRIGFVTPMGKIYITEQLNLVNGKCKYPLPQGLLDGKGLLLAQLLISEEDSFVMKSPVCEFPVYASVDDISCSYVSDSTLKSLCMIFDMLDRKSDISHTHDDMYLTVDEVQGMIDDIQLPVHEHDALYYRKNATNSLLAQKSDINHTHSGMLTTDDISDTVVESGTSGVWSYRKWSSGVAECWCNTSLPFSEDQCAGAGFSDMNLMYTDLTLPFSFVATPCAVCSVEWKYSEWAQCHAGTKSLRVRLFCNGNSKTYAIENGLKCSIHVKGNWQ